MGEGGEDNMEREKEKGDNHTEKKSNTASVENAAQVLETVIS